MIESHPSQASGLYPNKWALHDMGAHYPRAIAHNDGNDEPMPVEGQPIFLSILFPADVCHLAECGNMLIMILTYAQKTGDLTQIKQYYDLLDQWTQYLITDSLIPAEQLSTDDFAGYDMTSLSVDECLMSSPKSPSQPDQFGGQGHCRN